MTLAQNLVGSGITVSNANLVCAQDGAGFFTATAPSLGIGQGVVLTTGYANDPSGFGDDIASPNDDSGMGIDRGMPGDMDLEGLAANITFDACYLEFDLVPTGDTITFDYIFGSEEYNDFVNAGYNDVFGFFISGPGIPGEQNIAVVPGTGSTPVSIDNVNCGSFPQYYICNDWLDSFMGGCNSGDCPTSQMAWGPEYDGLTVVLTARALVQPCQTYHLKLGVSDVGDGVWDSGVFIKQGSLTSATVEVSPDVTICPGQTTQMSVTGYSAGATFQWTPATGLSCTNCPDPVANPSTTTTYSVTVSQSGSCSGSDFTDQVVVTVGGGIQATLTPTAANCGASDGSIATNVTTGTSPYTYAWSNGSTSANLTNVSAGDYTVSITDAIGCSSSFNATVVTTGGPTLTGTVTNSTCNQANGSIDVSVSGGTTPYGFSWSNGLVTEDMGGLLEGTYTLTLSDAAGCTLSESFAVASTTNPSITFTTVDPVCTAANGQIDITVTNGTAPFAFAWNTGDAAEDLTAVPSGSYSMTVTDANNCSATTLVDLVALAAPPIGIDGLVEDVCVGSAFTAAANGYDSYTWTPATGLSASTGAVVTVTVNANETYLVIGTDANGCSDSLSFNVTAVPYASVSYTDTFGGCEPLAVTLTALTQNASSVQWWANGQLISTQTTVLHNFYAGSYDGMLVAISPAGCNDTVTMPDFVNVLPSPSADFRVTRTFAEGSLFTYAFTNATLNATGYSWSFGDGTTETVADPIHAFPDYGQYQIVLTAYNDFSCTDTAMRFIAIDVPHEVFIPNTFTPNGDGANDLFRVYGMGIRVYKLTVFDRLGERVFEAEGNQPEWDGSFKGQPVNTGTFVYYTEIEFLDGLVRREWGDVNVLR
ncbi:MAG TPA: choice-of-anchor L domain-containing protein [Chitinophagales bacterium]|nr:choice-of-anchor L domain-containing protein [Chitinophagales bacterium]